MFKVMTMNLNYYNDKHGSWMERKSLIAEAIQSKKPDLVALQAVRSDPKVDAGMHQVAQLAELFPEFSNVFFQPVIHYAGGSAEGSGLLSKLEFSRLDVFPLSYLEGTEDPYHRVVIHARIDLADGPLHIFNGHFSWVSLQAAQNVAEFLGFEQVFEGKKLLLGDFNNPPDSEILINLQMAGWVDLWERLCPGYSGFTFESDRPSMRIDYVLANAAMAEEAESIGVVADRTHNGVRASDHFGVAATFR